MRQSFLIPGRPRDRPEPARRPSRHSVFQDSRGASAVEFAVIAPVLILLLLGMSDVAPALWAAQQLAHTTTAVADLTTEFSEMKTTDVANVYAAAQDIFSPLSSSTLNIRITSIYSNGNGNAYVSWSCGQGSLAPYVAGSAVTSTPTGTPVGYFVWLYNSYGGGYQRNGTNTAYVMSEGQYTYTALAQFVLRSPITLTHTAYLMPRQSSYVGFPWNGNSLTPPIAPTTTTHTGSVTLSNGATCNYTY